MSLHQGLVAEEWALRYLLNQGLIWLASNYRCRCGEIDLILQDKFYLVFVEVRSRTSMNYGGGVASVTYSKRQKLLKTANYYLLAHKLYDQCPMRFDVVSLDGSPPIVTWIKDAFACD